MKCVRFWIVIGFVLGISGLAGCDLPEPIVLDQGPNDSGPAEDASSEQVDPASIAYEPLPEHGRVELSNLRIERDNSFSVDWKKTAGEPYGTMLVVKQPDSSQTLGMVVNIWPDENSGTISGLVISFGSGASLRSGLEVYLVTREGEARHKISNSVTLGDASTTPTRPVPTGALGSATPPVLDNLVDLPAHVTVPMGTKLMIFSGGRYHNVTVEYAHPAGSLLIRWDDKSFSGVYPRSSLKIDKEVLAKLSSGAAPANAMANAPAYPTPQQTSPQPTASGRNQEKGSPIDEGLLAPIPADLQLNPGMRLYAFWAGEWLPVTVINPAGFDSAKIHWDGWSESWDEVKPRTDLRIERAKL